jgi:hypothetical protein
MSNSGGPEIADFGVAADISLDMDDAAPVAAIGNFRGFSAMTPIYKCTYITGKHPLVDDVTVYWFGYYYDRTEARWSQVVVDYFSGRDSALSFSWQDVLLPANSITRKSVIVKFGDYEIARLELQLAFPDLSGEWYSKKAIEISGIVRATGTLSNIKLILVINGEAPDFLELPGSYGVNSEFKFGFVPAEFGLDSGQQTFEFFAVDEFGDVSAGNAVTVRLTENEAHAVESSNTALAVGLSLGAVAVIGIAIACAVFCLRKTKTKALPNDADLTLGSGSAVGTEGLKAYMADELLPD